MNTLTHLPLLNKKRHGNFVIALDDLEFAFPVLQLEKIRELNNEGYSYKEISKKVRRDEYEVIIALLHICREGHLVGPMGGYKND